MELTSLVIVLAAESQSSKSPVFSAHFVCKVCQQHHAGAMGPMLPQCHRSVCEHVGRKKKTTSFHRCLLLGRQIQVGDWKPVCKLHERIPFELSWRTGIVPGHVVLDALHPQGTHVSCSCVSIYLSICPSVCLSVYLSICKIENKAILQDFLVFQTFGLIFTLCIPTCVC